MQIYVYDIWWRLDILTIEKMLLFLIIQIKTVDMAT